jgi:DNA-binding protein
MGMAEAVSNRPGSRFDVVYVGRKPLMRYVTAIVMGFSSGNKELTVKARGRMISKAVDVVENCRRRFFAGRLDVVEIKIGTDVLWGTYNVSRIEVKLRLRD